MLNVTKEFAIFSASTMKSEEPSQTRSRRLTPVETGFIELCVQYSRPFGLLKSAAQIYGLLFVSPVPLSFFDLKERLELSAGSTSQGLKYLRELGAVRVVDPNQRRTHYEAVAELRKLAAGYLQQQVMSPLSDSETRLDRLTEQAQSLTGEAKTHALARISTLRVWHKNSRRLLPILLKLLGGK
jgi:DNA-binding transcriptional regulator GbsR (MarR family)